LYFPFCFASAFYVVKQAPGHLFFNYFLSLQGKSEEEVSSAGEQLTSNRNYDGDNTRESFLKERLFFVVIIVTMAQKTHLRLPCMIFQ
jgi:hypothetical protein